MNPRKTIKNSHENYVTNQFLIWYNKRYRGNYIIIEKPDPPDAIACSKNKTIWIEHGDIYRSWDEAREEYSAVIHDEKYILHLEHPIREPDEKTAIALLELIENKKYKQSYEKYAIKYGKGILVANERDPLFDDWTICTIKRKTQDINSDYDLGFFKAVYLSFRTKSGLNFLKLLPKGKE
jgi:hypothetical protein